MPNAVIPDAVIFFICENRACNAAWVVAAVWPKDINVAGPKAIRKADAKCPRCSRDSAILDEWSGRGAAINWEVRQGKIAPGHPVVLKEPS